MDRQVGVAGGDPAMADDDGVVVWPRARVAALLDLARAKLERARAARIASGGSHDDPPASTA